MTSGIYQIRNLADDKIYIGSARNLIHRKACHFSMLLHNKHRSGHLQNSYNKYGKENFVFEILITCDPSLLLFYEQQFIDQWNPEYNIYKVVGSNHSNISTEKQRKDQSERMLGNNYKLGKKESEETRLKKSIAKTGNHHTKETKLKISLAKKLWWENKKKVAENL